MRILIDITNPDRPIVHKGGRRKNRRYVAFTVRYGFWHHRFLVDGYDTHGSPFTL